MESFLGPHFNDLMLVYGAYVIATLSPGPSNMAIMGVAMHSGRSHALMLAAGVVTGSMFWATLAATGISVILASYAQALTILRIAGGAYLLYLAWKSAKSVLSVSHPAPKNIGNRRAIGALYLRGLMLHLTNPKAVFAWLAIMSLGLKGEVSASVMVSIVAGCAILGSTVFGGYALIFSTGPMVRLYQNIRRPIEMTLALFFGYAGLNLLFLRH